MRIRFAGPQVVRRVVGQYEWSRETGFVQDVDAATAAELLTCPGEDFVPDRDEPLLSLDGVGMQRLAELALAGIGNLADMADLNDEGIERLAESIWASEDQVRRWVEQAREILYSDKEVEG